MSVRSAVRGAGAIFYSNVVVNLPNPSPTSELSQQIFIVTGSNTGLGLESARHLSRFAAAKIILAVRSESKGQEAKKDILTSTNQPENSIEVWPLDMSSYDSVKAFAARASSNLPRIDGVLANAGIMTTNFQLSEGLEQTLNVNVVSTFLLYALLAPKMRDSAKQTGNACRFAIPNSALHYMAAVGELKSREPGLMERLSDADQANMEGRYNLSKLLVIYAVRELAQRDAASGKSSIIVNTPNPSWCKSNLARERAGETGFKFAEKVFARSTEEGSRTLVHGLLAGKESNGQYLNDCHVAS